MTAKEAAKKWNVSIRLIQRYCSNGRIKGARKSGNVWEIPCHAIKPTDPRRKEEDNETDKKPSFQNLMPLMNTPFRPGECKKRLNSMKEGARKDIAYAEYYYFRGNPQMSAQIAKQYLTCSNTELRLSACLIYAFSNLSIGQIEQAKQVLEKIKSTLKEDKERAQQIKVIDAFIAMAAAVRPDGRAVPSASASSPRSCFV